MGKFFTSLVHIQNDQRVMGIILRYVCWGTHRPPPPPRGAWRLAARPADPQGLGQPRGGDAPPPPNSPQNCHTPRGHTLVGGGPRVLPPSCGHGGGGTPLMTNPGRHTNRWLSGQRPLASRCRHPTRYVAPMAVPLCVLAAMVSLGGAAAAMVGCRCRWGEGPVALLRALLMVLSPVGPERPPGRPRRAHCTHSATCHKFTAAWAATLLCVAAMLNNSSKCRLGPRRLGRGLPHTTYDLPR